VTAWRWAWVALLALALCGGKAMADAAAPLRSNVTLANGMRLSYLQWGAPGAPGAPKLLLLHGRGSNAAEAADFAAALAAEHQVIAVDLRGCGFSDWARDGDYSVEASVADLEHWMAAMGWNRFVVYGHSYGAVVGIAFAARHPARVSALVLEDGGPVTRRDGSDPVLNPGQSARAGTPVPQPVPAVYPSWEAMVAAQPLARGRPAPLALEARFVRGADGQVRARADVLGLWKSPRGEGFLQPWPLVQALAMPTLLIRADRGLVPEGIAADMLAANPKISVSTVAQSGHGIHFEHPAEVLALTRAFIARQGAAAPAR